MSIKQPFFKNIGNDMYLQMGTPAIIAWDTKTRPKNARVGTLGFNTDTSSLEYWDGEQWLAAKLE